MRCPHSLELSCRAHFSQVTLAIILNLYSQPISRISYSSHLKHKQEKTLLETTTAFSRVTLALLHNTLVCEVLSFSSFSLNCTFTVVLPPPPLTGCVSFLGVLGSCVPVLCCMCPVELLGIPYHDATDGSQSIHPFSSQSVFSSSI